MKKEKKAVSCTSPLYFLHLDRKRRAEETRAQGYQNGIDLLPYKQISLVPSDIEQLQKQILRLIAEALDINGAKKTVSERMGGYYRSAGSDTLNTYRFRPYSKKP